MMPTGTPTYFSPKRKREASESDYYSPSASPTSTVSAVSLQESRIRDETEPGRHSPRAVVAGHFKDLAIRGEHFPDRRGSNHDLQQPQRVQAGRTACISDSHDRGSMSLTEPLQVHSGKLSDAQHHHTDSDVATHHMPDNALVIPISTPSKKRPTQSSHQNIYQSPSKGRKPRLSPPPSDVPLDDPFTWHDHEITGHNPTDPTDDGYGINGVGFKPTAAIAWARSQKRQRQVAEWKSREAREAREKRRERRNENSGMDRLRSIHEGAVQKRVKFNVQDKP
ncbi:hypothetical protein F1880_000379 [Penicillium rolfsii]|nr:hypothetical protein F1880_000379 [Penicillium rolfsii]